MQRKIKNKTKVIAIILAILIVVSISLPLFNKVFADETPSSNSTKSSTSAAKSISSSSNIILNYYKITDPESGKDIEELTKNSPAFDLTLGLLDPNVEAIDGFENGTGYVVLESASFYGETTNTGTLRQTGNTNSDGPMKMIANFKNVKFNGQSNTLTVRVGYTTSGGTAKSELVSFLVSQIPIEEEDDDTKKDPAPPPSPKIVIDECTYGGNTINTEQSFTLNFNYFNSSNAVKMENLKIEVSGGENFVIKNNSNTFYVEELGPKGIKDQAVDFTALKSIKESSSYPITLKFTYEYVINKERKTGEDKSEIYIPVHKLVPAPRLTISDISLDPSEIEEDEESTVTIQLANKGESEVKNVSVAISGNFKSSSYVKEVGTIASGKVTSPSFTITTLPATKANAAITSDKKDGKTGKGDQNQDGQQNKADQATPSETSEVKPKVDNKITGTVVITFEDEDGKQHTIDRNFGLNVNVEEEDDFSDGMDMGQDAAGEIPEEGMENASSKKLTTPVLIGIISGVVVVLGGTTFFIIKKIRKKRSELLDEDI